MDKVQQVKKYNNLYPFFSFSRIEETLLKKSAEQILYLVEVVSDFFLFEAHSLKICGIKFMKQDIFSIGELC